MTQRTDIEYIATMMRCYKELHEKLLALDSETKWPDCGRPDNRFQTFIEFMKNQENDEWAWYYTNIAEHLEALIWQRIPKDKRNSDSL